MANWKQWHEETPPEGKLVIVNFGDFEGYGLRKIVNGELYDEHEFNDDSEIVPQTWAEIPG